MPITTPDPSGYIANNGGLPGTLWVPPGYHRAGDEFARRNTQLRNRSFSQGCQDGFAYGLRLERDPETLVVRWAAKGSGMDDLINQAIADGNIGNVGISPIIFAQINGLIKRRQNQTLGASIVTTGRKTPAGAASAAISRWNDTPLGAVDAVRKIVYQLDTYNRGAPIATVPLWLPIDDWEQEGLLLHALAGHSYWLEVDWRVRRSPVPYLPSVFDLEPTGYAEWPYWFRKADGATEHWILLHESQIVSLLNSWSGQPGVGTSAVYICLGFLGEHALAIDERYEAMIDGPGEGILAISGVSQGAQQIRATIEGENETTPGGHPGHDWTLLASPNDIKVGMHRWRTWDHVAFQDRQQHFEDVLALAFDEPLSSVVIRGGVGYGTQSDDASNNNAEGGVFSVLKALELVLGTIYPRVSISVTKVNDRARLLTLGLLDRFATAVAKLPAGTLTIEEIRAYIDRDLLTIPSTKKNIIQEDARAGTASENEDQLQVVSAAIEQLDVEAAALMVEIITSLPAAEITALINETNQVVASLQVSTLIEELATGASELSQRLNQWLGRA